MEPNLALVGNLRLPNHLIKLIEAGRWPGTHEEELHQNIQPLVSKETIRSFAPDQERIYFVKPPFNTVAERMASHEGEFWSRFGALEEISPDLSVFIGDFGLGSDSPILLDYAKNPLCPAVIRLQWSYGEGQRNQWLVCADSFDAFSELLGF